VVSTLLDLSASTHLLTLECRKDGAEAVVEVPAGAARISAVVSPAN
jgi:hypothetical protein